MISILDLKRKACGHNTKQFGGSSKSTTATSTESNDMRVVGADGSINSSAKFDVSGSGNTIMSTDAGAVRGSLNLAGDTVNQALSLALKGIEQSNQLSQDTVAANGSILTGALTMAGDQQQAFTNTVKDIKTSDVRVLVITGLAVVGLGAAMVFKKAA